MAAKRLDVRDLKAPLVSPAVEHAAAGIKKNPPEELAGKGETMLESVGSDGSDSRNRALTGRQDPREL